MYEKNKWKIDYLNDVVENNGKTSDLTLSNYTRIPIMLYKYIHFQNCSDEKIDSFKNNKLYLSSPVNFNDPYDCEFNTDILEQIQYVVKKFEKSEMQKVASNREERRILQKQTKHIDKEIRQDIENFCKVLESEWEKFRKTIAVCCLSELVDSMLMWCHYADSYKGVCIAYDFKELMQKGMVLPVVYTDELTSLKKYICNIQKQDDMYIAGIHAVTAKALEWEYESEWRIIDTIASGLNGKLVDMSTPKAIYIGNKMHKTLRDEIIRISKNIGISEINDINLNKHKYGLSFKSI